MFHGALGVIGAGCGAMGAVSSLCQFASIAGLTGVDHQGFRCTFLSSEIVMQID